MSIQVILTQNVPHLGLLGDEVQVKNGFARNYLLPRGMAIVANTRNARQIQHRRKQLETLREAAIAEARGITGQVAALQLVVKAKAGPGGRLFGSVTNRDIQALLAEHGYPVDRKRITLHEPIKTLGTFGVTVKLHTEVKTDVQVRVEQEGETVSADGETELPGGETASSDGETTPPAGRESGDAGSAAASAASPQAPKAAETGSADGGAASETAGSGTAQHPGT